MDQAHVVTYLNEQSMAAVATVSQEGRPEAATIYFEVDDELNFYFLIRSDSRKYKNLQHNPMAALVVSSEHPLQTVQVEGEVASVVDKDALASLLHHLKIKAKNKYWAPPFTKLEGNLKLMKLSPDWLRVGEFGPRISDKEHVFHKIFER
jgi:pyridoxine/pyridoxamine 5'-phosphate oxidase